MKNVHEESKNRGNEKPAKAPAADTAAKNVVGSGEGVVPSAKCECPPGCVRLPCCS